MSAVTHEAKAADREGDVEKGEHPSAAQEVEPQEEEIQYPGWRKLTLIMTSLYLSMFIVALVIAPKDRTIIGTALPKITDEFHSIKDVGWYASAYLITLCAFQLIFGRIYTFYSPKWVMLWAIFIFEVGSALCGAAPSSIAFILGRAISGFGSAGIFGGAVKLMVMSVPLHKRPMFQGLFGAVFGVASVTGPLLGGVFTSEVTWRWCFYINIPIGVVVVAVVSFCLKSTPPKKKDSLKVQILKLDPFGSAVFLPAIICLLLALQWGGTEYPWDSARIIVLFILSGLLLIIFVVIQFKSGERATVPIRIINQRSILSGVYMSLVAPGSMMVMIYYLPIWFQAIKGDSAVTSGIDTIPLVLGLVVASIMSGVITAKTGYYTGQMIASSIISAIGAGMLTTLKPDSPSSKWIGYEILFGFGIGLGLQQPGMAAQACLNNQDVMTGVALMFFFQGLGGAVWVQVAQSIFTHSLISDFSHIANLNPMQIVNTGATEIRNLVPIQMLPEVLLQYNSAVTTVFKVAVGLSSAGILGGLTMEWRSVKNKTEGGTAGDAQGKKATSGGKREASLDDGENTGSDTIAPSRTSLGDSTLPQKTNL